VLERVLTLGRRGFVQSCKPDLLLLGPVLVKVNYHEVKLRNAVKEAGGQWQPKEKTWKLPYDTAIELGLDQRIVKFLGNGE
jgi:hypothetical protein